VPAWTLGAEPEAVAQSVQFPHPTTWGTAVECEDKIPGEGVVAESGWRDAICGVQMADRFRIALRPVLHQRPS
jgi:hypothetical protein